MPRHQHRDNRGLRVVLTAAGRGRARFILRLLGVGATDTAASLPLCGRDLQSIISPLQGWGICDPWTQGVALGYHILPRWGQARSAWWIACRTVTAMIVRVAAAVAGVFRWDGDRAYR